MNFNPDNFDSIASQFSSLSFPDPTTTLPSVPTLQRSTSLLDSIGVQRADSPFISRQEVNGFKPPLSHMGSWTQHQSINPNQIFQSQLPLSSQLPQQPFGTQLTSVANAPVLLNTNPISISSHEFGMSNIPESQWKYIDQSGQLQGPFGSRMMDSWHAQRFFSENLNIALSSYMLNPLGFIESQFVTLLQLINATGDVMEPFHKFDTISWVFKQQSQHQLMPSNHQGIELEQVVNQSDQNNTYTNTTKNSHHRITVIDSPDYKYDEILQLRDSNGGYYHSTLVQIPVDKIVHQIDTFHHAFELQEQKRSFDPPNNLKDSTIDTSVESNKVLTLVEDKYLAQQEIETGQKKRISCEGKESLNQENYIKPKQEDASGLYKSDENIQLSPQSIKEKHEKYCASKELKVKLAPWANKSQQVIEGPSLADIRKKEIEQKKKRDEEREREELEIALKLQQEALNAEKPIMKISSIASWANKPLTPTEITRIKSFDQLQKDRTDEQSFIEEQKRLWEEAKKRAKLHKHSIKEEVSEPKWTTVTKKQQRETPKVVSQSSHINPDKLRSVSAGNNTKFIKSTNSHHSSPASKQQAPSPILYSGNASTSARQEFLKWCKSQMKLSTGIEVNSVLEMLLSLPASNESQEIIADTIYSNSSTMDGRRFASQFIKKRLECERKLNDPLTWREALLLPEGNADDWEFQVVGKRKGKRY